MGLDQNAYYRQPGDLEQHAVELAYWRKHNRLEGWMTALYEAKGGTEVFNCQNVYLTLEDLDQLEAVINDKKLPETGGFFFGTDSYDEYESEEMGYKQQDLEFIETAKEKLENGCKVWYTSWW